MQRQTQLLLITPLLHININKTLRIASKKPKKHQLLISPKRELTTAKPSRAVVKVEAAAATLLVEKAKARAHLIRSLPSVGPPYVTWTVDRDWPHGFI